MLYVISMLGATSAEKNALIGAPGANGRDAETPRMGRNLIRSKSPSSRIGMLANLACALASAALFAPCVWINSLETSLDVYLGGKLALNLTIPDNPFGYWQDGAYGSGVLLLGFSGVAFFARHLLVLVLSFCRPTPCLERVVRYLHKMGKLSLGGLVVSVVLYNAVSGLRLSADFGTVTNNVNLSSKWGIFFLVAGTVASTAYSHLIGETYKKMLRESSHAPVMKISPKRDLALAVIDSAGIFRGLLVAILSVAVYLFAWLCGTVYSFSYGGVFGPSASTRLYSPENMITSLEWQLAFPFALFSWVFPALLIIQCAGRCFQPRYLLKRGSKIRALLSPSVTALLASCSFTEFLLAAQILVAPEVNTIVNQTLHDQSLTPNQRGLEKLLCGSDACLSVQDTLHVLPLIAFILYALLPWFLPFLTELVHDHDDVAEFNFAARIDNDPSPDLSHATSPLTQPFFDDDAASP